MKVFLLTMGAILLSAQPPDQTQLALTLQATETADHSLRCDLDVLSKADVRLTLRVPAAQAFSVAVIDASGKDWNEAESRPVKRGKSRLAEVRKEPTTVIVNPRAEVRLSRTLTLRDDAGNPVRLPAGEYTIQARLVSVEFAVGKYQTALFRSNSVKLRIQ